MMYVVERIEGDSIRPLLATPERAPAVQLLLLIARSRARSTRTVSHIEHLRSLIFRLKTGSDESAMISLSGERFRIREDDSVDRSPSWNRRTLRRIARIPELSPILVGKSQIEAAADALGDRSGI